MIYLQFVLAGLSGHCEFDWLDYDVCSRRRSLEELSYRVFWAPEFSRPQTSRLGVSHSSSAICKPHIRALIYFIYIMSYTCMQIFKSVCVVNFCVFVLHASVCAWGRARIILFLHACVRPGRIGYVRPRKYTLPEHATLVLWREPPNDDGKSAFLRVSGFDEIKNKTKKK